MTIGPIYQLQYVAEPMDSHFQCVECLQPKPLNAQHFSRDKSKENGFYPLCKKCRQKRRSLEKKVQRAEKKLEQLEKLGLSVVLNMPDGGELVPHSAEMVEALMQGCGGVQGFAKIVWVHFYQCPVGGSNRTKLLEAIARLTAQNSLSGGAKKPFDLMDDEELLLTYQQHLATSEAARKLRLEYEVIEQN